MDSRCYNHPILWCEQRRKLEEQKVAVECEVQASLNRQRKKLNKMREMEEVIFKINDLYKLS